MRMEQAEFFAKFTRLISIALHYSQNKYFSYADLAFFIVLRQSVGAARLIVTANDEQRLSDIIIAATAAKGAPDGNGQYRQHTGRRRHTRQRRRGGRVGTAQPAVGLDIELGSNGTVSVRKPNNLEQSVK